MDPIVVPTYYNRTTCALLRLPEELLVEIMLYLKSDATDLQCLREASRTFLRLFASREFRHLHESPEYPRLNLWPVCRLDRREDARELCSRLDRDAYCAPCLRVKRAGSKEPRYVSLFETRLHCAPCGTSHPAMLFSPKNRRASPPLGRGRRCIAHEGHLRVCQHATVSWADVQGWFDHTRRTGEGMTITLCDDPSHYSSCPSRRWQPKGEAGVRAQVVWSAIAGSLAVFYLDSHIDTAHDGAQFTESRLRAVELRHTLRTLFEDAGRFLVPDSDEVLLPSRMAALDPSACRCVKYQGAEILTLSARPLHPPPLLWRSGVELEGYTLCEKCSPGVVGYARHRCGAYSWRDLSSHFELTRCGDCPTGARVCEMALFPMFGTKSQEKELLSWCSAMDPWSYGLEGDSHSRNVFWCMDPGCRNYCQSVRNSRFKHYYAASQAPAKG